MNIYEALDTIGAAEIENVAPGAFKIIEATLHHGPGKEYPIGALIKEIKIFEDIERIGVTGTVDLHDNINLFQGGPMIGHELLYLRAETGGASEAGIPEFGLDFTTHPLFVYKVENMTTGNSGGGPNAWLDYRLHFCSTEMLKNNRVRVSKAYQGTLDAIVEKVLKEELKTIKPIIKKETLDVYHEISPNIRPFDFIRNLLPKAQKIPDANFSARGKKTTSGIFKGRVSDFLFYETSTRMDGTGGFNFLPSQDNADFPNLTFTLTNSKNTGGVTGATDTKGGYAISMLTSDSYSYKFLGDKYNTISSGLWAAKHIRHNAYKKSFSIYKSDYYKQLKHPRFSLVSETLDYQDTKMITEYPDAKIHLSSTQSSRENSNINTQTRRVDYPWTSSASPGDSLLRTMQLGHLLGSHRLEFTIPGCSRLSVGQMAFADLPEIGYAGGQKGLEGSSVVWENRLENTWVVTKVAHRFMVQGSAAGYSTKVEIANTMSATAKVLPNYGELGSGYGVG